MHHLAKSASTGILQMHLWPTWYDSPLLEKHLFYLSFVFCAKHHLATATMVRYQGLLKFHTLWNNLLPCQFLKSMTWIVKKNQHVREHDRHRGVAFVVHTNRAQLCTGCTILYLWCSQMHLIRT